ncbi:response regulator transcription factor [Vibrio agarivorans]|uniref:LuxR C-terminal-related transcriptional regulator n=1 Tax=Vibrio agarivorans TaxID=153622 RepID=A0ABT7Y073_9VIBR|nr:LuxR C-terminal-related transcriptional regulator [Vibrio agarivorans]MDN2481189.1 LuxR C-terminal-related transcriptional regulator [Vibrio agarivorans]
MDTGKITSFSQFIQSQIQTMTTCQAKDFNETFKDAAIRGLEWFNLDRLTMFPNSMILLNDGKTVTVARSHVPKVDKNKLAVGNFPDYLKQLRSKSTFQVFNSFDLANSPISTLRILHQEGAHSHIIVKLELFGQTWGAVSFSSFDEHHPGLSKEQLDELRALCNIWLVYWQHSTMTQSLNHGAENYVDEGEKLLMLSKKQCAVLGLLAQGLTAKQCAEKLFLSPRTIESHKYRMLDILMLDNHTELVQFALRNGLGIEE